MRFYLIFICTLFSSVVFGQFAEADIKVLIKTATSDELVYFWNGAIEETEYHAADMISDALIKKNPNNKNFIYRKGVSTFYYKKDFKLALGYLKKAVSNVSDKHNPESGMETKAPLEAYYYYAYLELMREKKCQKSRLRTESRTEVLGILFFYNLSEDSIIFSKLNHVCVSEQQIGTDLRLKDVSRFGPVF